MWASNCSSVYILLDTLKVLYFKMSVFMINFFFFNFIYLFIYGCVGSSFLCEGFLQLRQVGATLHHGARASHYRGLSCCGTQALDAQAQQLWLTVAPRHVGSSQTRARTCVPCLAGRFSTTAPPGKPVINFLKLNKYIYFPALGPIPSVSL